LSGMRESSSRERRLSQSTCRKRRKVIKRNTKLGVLHEVKTEDEERSEEEKVKKDNLSPFEDGVTEKAVARRAPARESKVLKSQVKLKSEPIS